MYELSEQALIVSIEDRTDEETPLQIVPLHAVKQFCAVWQRNLYVTVKVGYYKVSRGGMLAEFISVGQGFIDIPELKYKKD